MDVNDMSVALNIIQGTMERKEAIPAAQAQEYQSLTWPESRKELLTQHRIILRNIMKLDLQPRSDFVPSAYPPCIVPFSGLTKTMIEDLCPDTHHEDQYLIVRCIAPPYRLISVMSVVEDECGHAVMLTLCHQDEAHPLDEILAEGMILAVKEPYVRRMKDGAYGIIVDHVSNYKYLSMKDDLMPRKWQEKRPESQDNATTWDITGNELVEKDMYFSAIRSYTEGLGCRPTEEELCALKLNRSVAYFMTDQLESALLDIESVEKMSKADDNLLLGKARVLYGMQKYREYLNTVKLLSVEGLKTEELKRKLRRKGIDRLIEQERGRYQFHKLYDEVSMLRPPVLDHATYIGPVAVKSADHRGRGLFTTKEVKAGDLLLCEKASGFAFVDESSPDNRPTLLINAQQGTATVGAQVDLLTIMIQKLQKNPSLIPVISELHHGSYKPVGVSFVDDAPVIDTFLIEKVLSLNIFASQLTTRDSWLGPTTENDACVDNSNGRFGSCGIWRVASYINHSCNINAQRSFIGDMIIVRASRDLAPDTEVLTGYGMPSADGYDGLQRKFQHYGFECDCAMCQDYRDTSKETHLKRNRLVAEASEEIERITRPKTAKVEAIVKRLAACYTRPALEVPRLGLWDIQLELAEKDFICHKPRKAVELGLKGLESLGYVIQGGGLPYESGTTLKVIQWGLMMPLVLRCWVLLSLSYQLVAPELEAHAKAYAKITYRVCIGEDETFDKAYREFLL